MSGHNVRGVSQTGGVRRTAAGTLGLAVAAAVVVSTALYFLVGVGESSLGPGERVAATLGAMGLLYGLATATAPYVTTRRRGDASRAKREVLNRALVGTWLRANVAVAELYAGHAALRESQPWVGAAQPSASEPYPIDLLSDDVVAPEDRVMFHLLAHWYVLILQGQLAVPLSLLEQFVTNAERLAGKLESALEGV